MFAQPFLIHKCCAIFFKLFFQKIFQQFRRSDNNCFTIFTKLNNRMSRFIKIKFQFKTYL